MPFVRVEEDREEEEEGPFVRVGEDLVEVEAFFEAEAALV